MAAAYAHSPAFANSPLKIPSLKFLLALCCGALAAGLTAPNALAHDPDAEDPNDPRNAVVVFNGGGWGHGVGMSQYGALGRALAGESYKKILNFYYHDTTISNLSDFEEFAPPDQSETIETEVEPQELIAISTPIPEVGNWQLTVEVAGEVIGTTDYPLTTRYVDGRWLATYRERATNEIVDICAGDQRCGSTQLEVVHSVGERAVIETFEDGPNLAAFRGGRYLLTPAEIATSVGREGRCGSGQQFCITHQRPQPTKLGHLNVLVGVRDHIAISTPIEEKGNWRLSVEVDDQVIGFTDYPLTTTYSRGRWQATYFDEGANATINICEGDSRCAGTALQVVQIDGTRTVVEEFEDGANLGSYAKARYLLQPASVEIGGSRPDRCGTGQDFCVVVDRLDMEDYLHGLAEVPPLWPDEVLKAQAVAARSYAAATITNRRAHEDWDDEPFNLYATTSDQVFLGWYHSSSCDENNWCDAVDETASEVLVYEAEVDDDGEDNDGDGNGVADDSGEGVDEDGNGNGDDSGEGVGEGGDSSNNNGDGDGGNGDGDDGNGNSGDGEGSNNGGEGSDNGAGGNGGSGSGNDEDGSGDDEDNSGEGDDGGGDNGDGDRGDGDSSGESPMKKTTIVHAFYSSSNGGHTSKPSDLWTGGVDLPFLKPKPDKFDEALDADTNERRNSNFEWKREYTIGQLTRWLNNHTERGEAPLNLSTLTGIDIVSAPESGRTIFAEITVKDDSKEVKLTRNEDPYGGWLFRAILNGCRATVGCRTPLSSKFTITWPDLELANDSQAEDQTTEPNGSSETEQGPTAETDSELPEETRNPTNTEIDPEDSSSDSTGSSRDTTGSSRDSQGSQTAANSIDISGISPTAFYYEAAQWAEGENLTAISSPETTHLEDEMTRAEFIELLWKFEGEIKPRARELSANDFTDVSEDASYFSAVILLSGGTYNVITRESRTEFSPDQTLNRAQVATFLWRFAGKPEPKGSTSLDDVDSQRYFATPVQWMVENGITCPQGSNFSPDNPVTWAQALTFIWRLASTPDAFSEGYREYYLDNVPKSPARTGCMS